MKVCLPLRHALPAYPCFLHKAIFALCLLSIVASKNLYGQDNNPANGYYVIVGTFSIKRNAEQFTRKLNRDGIACKYVYHEAKKLNYVYTKLYQGVDSAKTDVTMLRSKPEFFDAWVKRFPEEDPHNQFTHTPFDSVENKFQIKLFVNLFNGVNRKPVSGKINIIDSQALNTIGNIDGNKIATVNTNKHLKEVLVICNIFGYRKIEYKLNLNEVPDTTTHAVIKTDSAWVVEFALEPFRKGDIESLYNVYFFNDASIMREDSRYQLQELLTMMKDNPELKIKLHGHTNGTHFGKLISANNDQNFFSLKENVVKSIGSAKILALKRTEAVRNYLRYNGIEENRIEIKAWGGKRPLYHKDSHRAKMNLRVDVEIL